MGEWDSVQWGTLGDRITEKELSHPRKVKLRVFVYLPAPICREPRASAAVTPWKSERELRWRAEAVTVGCDKHDQELWCQNDMVRQ